MKGAAAALVLARLLAVIDVWWRNSLLDGIRGIGISIRILYIPGEGVPNFFPSNNVNHQLSLIFPKM